MEEKICAICRKDVVQKCSGCGNVYYCSREHQKQDWKKHAKVCRAFKLCTNETLGRHYTAARNIKLGEIIFNEQPIVSGPMHNSQPVCLNCYVVLGKHNAVPCKNCGWPLCGMCTEHGPECEFTKERRESKVSITEFGVPHPTYQCINVVRALTLKTKNRDAYEKLLSFEDHCEELRKQGDFVYESPLNVVRFIKRFFKVDDFSEEEIAKIVGVLQVNGHEVPTTEPAHMAVYDLASFIEHSCKANCSKSFTNEGGLIIHAAVPIAKGEHISICYTDPLWGAANRRHHLLRTKFFECNCERCKDSTEFGTMFNAIKCSSGNCLGYSLPKSFLTDNSPDFYCQLCGTITPYTKIETLLERIGQELSQLQRNSVKASKEFLRRYSKVLHGNHYYNVDVKIALAQFIGQTEPGLVSVPEDLLVEKIGLCRKIDDLLQILAPAENRIRGLILFEMHAALAEFSRRHRDGDNLGLLVESKKCLQGALRLLRKEPDVLPEGKIAKRAERNLIEISAILKTIMSNNTAPL